MKIQSDLEQAKNPSIIRIANHLIAKASEDALLQTTFDKPNKSLDEMYKYVTSEARKQAVAGSACIDDETVYGWAQHYYDEDSIVMNVITKQKDTKAKVEEVELPDEDLDVFDF